MNLRLCKYFVICVGLSVMAVSCSTTRNAKREAHKEPKVDAQVYISGHELTDRQERLIREAMEWQGTPYKYGGEEKGGGTDCSGFVMSVYRDAVGMKLPRNSAAQAEFCKSVKDRHAHACDLVFFATGSDSSKVSHVGMILDTENFIHASSIKGVIITRFDNPWWLRRIVGFGRVPGM